MSETKIYNLESVGGCYPVTLLKYLLNYKKISSMIEKAEENVLKMATISVSSENCEACSEGEMKCRAHTCIERIADKNAIPVHDKENDLYLVKNEIYKKIGEDKLLVFYCPHTRLCTVYTDKNIRRIDAFLFDGAEDILGKNFYSEITQIDINELASNQVKMWFNDSFTITTKPQVDRRISYYLTPNK